MFVVSCFFFFSSRRRHTRFDCDWSSDVCSSDLIAGAPTDFWALDPVVLAFGSLGLNTQAPHPKTALLAANYMLSHEAQSFLTRKGRLPTRTDVVTHPPGVMEALQQKTVVVTTTSAEEHRKMQQTF